MLWMIGSEHKTDQSNTERSRRMDTRTRKCEIETRVEQKKSPLMIISNCTNLAPSISPIVCCVVGVSIVPAVATNKTQTASWYAHDAHRATQIICLPHNRETSLAPFVATRSLCLIHHYPHHMCSMLLIIFNKMTIVIIIASWGFVQQSTYKTALDVWMLCVCEHRLCVIDYVRFALVGSWRTRIYRVR